jgi:hypothetical protein
MEHKGSKNFSLHDAFEALGFDLADIDVKRALDADVKPEDRRALRNDSAATGTADRQIRTRKPLVVGISGFPPFGRSQLTAYAGEPLEPRKAVGWPLVQAILGAIGRPPEQEQEGVSSLVDVEPVIADELDQVLYSLVHGVDPQILFGVADTPSRRFEGTTAVNLPGLSFCLGFVCSSDVVNDWFSFARTFMGERDENTRLFAFKGEAGFDFLVGQCRIKPDRIHTYQFRELLQQFETLAEDMVRARLQGGKVLFVGDASLCNYLRGLLVIAKGKHTGDTNLLDFTIRTAKSLDDFKAAVKLSDEFPVPRFRLGFVLREDDRLVNLLEECLSGSFFPIFSGALATLYAPILANAMFLNWGVQFIILEPLPIGLGLADRLMFANACKHALRREEIAEDLRNAIEQKIDVVWGDSHILNIEKSQEP